MSHLLEKNCPYEDWTSEARIHCSNPEHFHCLKDDYERTVWLCAKPIWVKKGHCPEYNTGSRLLDITACPQSTQSKCPQQDYRSNAIDVEYACRYNMTQESSTMILTTNSSETNKNSLEVVVLLTLSTLLTIIVLVACILLYKYRRRSLNNGTQQEEFIDLIQETATERPTMLFDQAKTFLIRRRMVVITGVQGSGKTFLAKSLVKDLQKDGKMKDSVLICSLNQLRCVTNVKTDLFIIDDMFCDLQLYKEFKETLEALNEFLHNAEEHHVIIIIPSYIWIIYMDEFDANFYRVHVDVDKRDDSEKLAILQSLKAKYNLSSEVSERLIELEHELLVTSFDCIGFPALMSWLFKQPNVEQLYKCLSNPLQTIKNEIFSLKNAKTVEERGKFLVLSYMCLKDGRMDVQNVDRQLFVSLKKKYAPQFEDKDLAKYCERMVGYYLLNNGECCYEFDLNIMKKIVFASLGKESTTFVKDN